MPATTFVPDANAKILHFGIQQHLRHATTFLSYVAVQMIGVARVDAHLLQAFQELGDVEDVAHTTVAHRYRDDPKRRTTPPTRVRTPLPASAGGGHAATQPALTDVPTAAAASTARRITIISDSDDDVPLVKKKTERAKAAAASRCTCVDGAEMCSYCLQFEL